MEYQRFLTERMTTKQAYDFGYDAGLNGANTTNCNFGIFSSPENTKAWERGKAEGDKARKQK
jgi:hypothetical protein